MKKCSPEGRDCIEAHSSLSFNCSTTCEGIFAGVQLEDGNLRIEDEETMGGGLGEESEIDFDGKTGTELYREMYNRIREDLVKEMELMNANKRGEVMDKIKYLRLVSEYRNFKNNIRYFRFNSAANLSNFGNMN